MANRNFDGIMQGLREAVAHANGDADPREYRVHVPADVDVKAVRKTFGLTQGAFAASFGFSEAAVKDWEQNRRQPEAAARAFLMVIQKEPDAVMRALGVAKPTTTPPPARSA